MRRSLTLVREHLAELTPADLDAVNGAVRALTPDCRTLPVTVCLTYLTCNPYCHTEA